MEELGLTDYALKRRALAGHPGDWIARIKQIAEVRTTKLRVGVSGWDFDNQKHYLPLCGEQIMPHCASWDRALPPYP